MTGLILSVCRVQSANVGNQSCSLTSIAVRSQRLEKRSAFTIGQLSFVRHAFTRPKRLVFSVAPSSPVVGSDRSSRHFRRR